MNAAMLSVVPALTTQPDGRPSQAAASGVTTPTGAPAAKK